MICVPARNRISIGRRSASLFNVYISDILRRAGEPLSLVVVPHRAWMSTNDLATARDSLAVFFLVVIVRFSSGDSLNASPEGGRGGLPPSGGATYRWLQANHVGFLFYMLGDCCFFWNSFLFFGFSLAGVPPSLHLGSCTMTSRRLEIGLHGFHFH